MEDDYFIPYDTFLAEAKDKVKFPKYFLKADKYGNRKATVTWDGKPIRLSTPWLQLAFKVSDGKDYKNNNSKEAPVLSNSAPVPTAKDATPNDTTLSNPANTPSSTESNATKKAKCPPMNMTFALSTGEIKKDDDEYKFRQCLILLHKLLLEAAKTNSQAWFDKEKCSTEYLEETTIPIMEYLKDKETKRPKVEYGLHIKANLTKYPTFDQPNIDPTYVQGGIYEMKGKENKSMLITVKEDNVTTFINEKDLISGILEIEGISHTSHKNLKYKVKVFQLAFKRVKQVPTKCLVSTMNMPLVAGMADDEEEEENGEQEKDKEAVGVPGEEVIKQEAERDNEENKENDEAGPVGKRIKTNHDTEPTLESSLQAEANA